MAHNTQLAPITVTLSMNLEGWQLLRKQKAWLVAQHTDEGEGLLSLIDSIQDQAVDTGQVDQYDVFGTASEVLAQSRT